MHRQNVLVLGLLVLMLMAVLTAGYTTGRGPIGVLSYGVTRLRSISGGSSQLVSSDDLVSESKSPSAPEFAPGTRINS
jgi:hypothetical protein